VVSTRKAASADAIEAATDGRALGSRTECLAACRITLHQRQHQCQRGATRRLTPNRQSAWVGGDFISRLGVPPDDGAVRVHDGYPYPEMLPLVVGRTQRDDVVEQSPTAGHRIGVVERHQMIELAFMRRSGAQRVSTREVAVLDFRSQSRRRRIREGTRRLAIETAVSRRVDARRRAIGDDHTGCPASNRIRRWRSDDGRARREFGGERRIDGAVARAGGEAVSAWGPG
jgi:hypothetical protein